MKYEKKAPGIHLAAESAGNFACPDLLHESCLHYDAVTIAMCSHFRGLICPWVLRDSDKVGRFDCESEKPQHTKLFSRDQISNQVSST